MSAKQISVVLLILTSLSWSTLGIYMRILAEHFPVLQQVYLRVAVAAILLAIVGWRKIRWSTIPQIPIQDWLLLTLRACCMYLLGVSLSTVAFIDGQYSTMSLIKALPLTAILGFLVFKERVTAAKLFFVILSFIGASFLVFPDLINMATSATITSATITSATITSATITSATITSAIIPPVTFFGWNELLVLASAAFIAFSYGARTWQKSSINSWESTLIMFGLTIVIMVVASWAIGEPPIEPRLFLTSPVLFGLGMSGLLNAVGLVVINYALGYINITLYNNIVALQPAFGVVVGVLIYQDVVTIWEILGGAVIVLSIIGMNRVPNE